MDNETPKRDEKIYLASSMSKEHRMDIWTAAQVLRKTFKDVYVPMEHQVQNAWDYPNNEWGLMVFEDDIAAIDRSDYVVFLNYGREKTTAGCAWEAGYAFAKGKKVFVVEVKKHEDDEFITSLMIENGRYATLSSLKELDKYDWNDLPKSRTNSEQK